MDEATINEFCESVEGLRDTGNDSSIMVPNEDDRMLESKQKIGAVRFVPNEVILEADEQYEQSKSNITNEQHHSLLQSRETPLIHKSQELNQNDQEAVNLRNVEGSRTCKLIRCPILKL